MFQSSAQKLKAWRRALKSSSRESKPTPPPNTLHAHSAPHASSPTVVTLPQQPVSTTTTTASNTATILLPNTSAPSPPLSSTSPPQEINFHPRHSQPTRPNPLNIPEVLARVGFFIPLWSHYLDTPRFSPKQYLICTRVSRFWYNVLNNHFWFLVDDSHIGASSPTVHSVLAKNAHRIRILLKRHNFGGGFAYEACRNLIHLTVVPWVVNAESLMRANAARLTSFTWEGGILMMASDQYRLIPKEVLLALGGLTMLRELVLEKCLVQARELYPILGGLNYLEKLTLSMVTMYRSLEDGGKSTQGLGSLESLGQAKVMLTLPPYTPPESLRLWKLKELHLGRGFFRSRELMDFVGLCPDLERLVLENEEIKADLRKDESLAFKTLARNLGEGCRKLRAIEFSLDRTPVKGPVVMLEEQGYSTLLQCLVGHHYGGSNGTGGGVAKEPPHSIATATTRYKEAHPRQQQDWEAQCPVSFKADMPCLDYMTAISLTSISASPASTSSFSTSSPSSSAHAPPPLPPPHAYTSTLQSLVLMFHDGDTTSVQSNLNHTALILTSCPHLRILDLRYAFDMVMHQPMLLPEQASKTLFAGLYTHPTTVTTSSSTTIMNAFENISVVPWACERTLEQLTLNGFYATFGKGFGGPRGSIFDAAADEESFATSYSFEE